MSLNVELFGRSTELGLLHGRENTTFVYILNAENVDILKAYNKCYLEPYNINIRRKQNIITCLYLYSPHRMTFKLNFV